MDTIECCIYIDQSQKANKWYVMAEFQTFNRRYSLACVPDYYPFYVAPFLQDLGYVVCSTVSPKFVAFGLFILVFGILP